MFLYKLVGSDLYLFKNIFLGPDSSNLILQGNSSLTIFSANSLSTLLLRPHVKRQKVIVVSNNN